MGYDIRFGAFPRLQGNWVEWTACNVGDEAAPAGTPCGDLAVYRVDAATGEQTYIDQTSSTLYSDLPPETNGEPIQVDVTYFAAEDGYYTVAIRCGSGEQTINFFVSSGSATAH